MATVVLDEALARRLRAERAATGGDRYDEVWEGTYMMAPMPNNEHQWLVIKLGRILDEIVSDASLGNVYPGVNVSDRVAGWEHNFRVPDVAVYLNETNAVNHETFWHGGPDFAVEVASEGDQSREKLDFYASVNTRELLIIDRDPWQIELYRLENESLDLVAAQSSESTTSVRSNVLDLVIKLQSLTNSNARPSLIITHSNQTWTI